MFAYLFVGLILFFFGGITGIVNASVQMNNVVHNTTWIPAHFHTTVGGPVFMGYTGMTLLLVSKLLGKPVKRPAHAMWVPWLWLLGVALFSIAGSINGIAGEPRRTNLGLTYLNPGSTLYRPEWQSYGYMMALGGLFMALSCVLWFVTFFTTLFGKPDSEPELDFPESETLHRESAGWTANFKPWVVAAALLIVISYVPPLLGLSRGTYGNAPRYSPGSPVAEP